MADPSNPVRECAFQTGTYQRLKKTLPGHYGRSTLGVSPASGSGDSAGRIRSGEQTVPFGWDSSGHSEVVARETALPDLTQPSDSNVLASVGVKNFAFHNANFWDRVRVSSTKHS